MKKNVVLIVNPVSGDLDKAEMIAAVKSVAATKNYNVILFETSGNDDEKGIKALYEKHQPGRVLIAGGDGTIKMVAEALQDLDVIFGILPAGSANGLSVDLNLPQIQEAYLEVAFGDHFIELDMICINDKKSLHLSDLGLNAELVRNYENSTTRGMIGYALQAITTLTEQAAPFEATIDANGETTHCVARMIVIANSKKYGTGVIINPESAMDDGKFEIVILKNLDLMVFGKIITGNMPLESGDIEIISTDKAKIATNVAVCFQIDGEYCGEESKLDIHILKRQMKVAIANP